MKKRVIIHIIFIIVLIVLANISLYFYIYFDDIRKNTTFSTELFLNEKSSINYNIQTSNNDYLANTKFNNYNPKDINKVDVSYNYSITFDKVVTGEYSYYVRGYLFDSTDNKKELYRSTDFKYNITDKNVISIGQLTSINVKDIIGNNNLGELTEPNIKYEMVVNYHVYNRELDKYISNSKTIEINIPVANKDDNKIIKSTSEEKGYKEFSNDISVNNKKYLVICFEFLGSVILYILCIAYLIENIYPKTYVFDREYEYIKNKYKKYLVDINFIPNLSDKEVKFVDEVDELVNYSKLYRVPIDYFEVIKHKEIVFAVIYGKKAFVYKISVKRGK